MLEKDLKIFIGPSEIANVGATIGEAFRKRGIRVTVVSKGKSPFRIGMKYDKVLSPPDIKDQNKICRIIKLVCYWSPFFLNNFFRNNSFIFLFGNTLFPKNLDLPFYKYFGKKTIMWFLGDDIKDIKLREVELRKMGIKYFHNEAMEDNPEEKEKKIRMIHKVEKYVDYIITGPSIAHLLTRDYLGKDLSSRVYLPFDISSLKRSNLQNDKIMIVHAPSDAQIKGTKYVLDAILQLEKEGYEIDFRLLKNVPNPIVRETLSQADIAIDQLFAFGPGMFALEAMTAGCVVLGGNMPQVSGYPLELPIIRTDQDNIYQNVKMLLDNPKMIQVIGKQSRKYVEKYHDSRKIADKIVNILTIGRKVKDI